MNTQTQSDKTCNENESAFKCLARIGLEGEKIRLDAINLTTYIEETT